MKEEWDIFMYHIRFIFCFSLVLIIDISSPLRYRVFKETEV